MENDGNNENNEGWKTKTLVTGALLGALTGLSAAYLLVQRADRERRPLVLNAGEGIKVGLLLLGLLRQVAQLGEGD
jgi:hypothetical protein